MSDMLSIGVSGLKAYTRALAAVSDNIANSQTTGYARRSIRLEDQSTLGDRPLYFDRIKPNGVAAVAVQRSVDEWLIADARNAGSEAGRSSARLSWVESVERALNDGPSGVGQSITALFNAADVLAANPDNNALRSNFLQKADQVAASFRNTAANLQSIAVGVANDAQLTADSLNINLTALKKINDGLQIARAGSSNHASLLDERDKLIDQISSALGVSVTVDQRGLATLHSSDGSGTLLLGIDTVKQIGVSVSSASALSFTVDSSVLTPSTGKLAGLVDAASQLSGRRQSIDTLSAQLATDINSIHQAGIDANGSAGGPLFFVGNGAADLALLVTDPAKISAADGTSANGAMLNLAGLRGAVGSEAAWASLVTQQGIATSNARAQDAAARSRFDQADDARNAVSGVDLDREAAELLRYQQAYDGAARAIQVARETMQSILNIF